MRATVGKTTGFMLKVTPNAASQNRQPQQPQQQQPTLANLASNFSVRIQIQKGKGEDLPANVGLLRIPFSFVLSSLPPTPSCSFYQIEVHEGDQMVTVSYLPPKTGVLQIEARLRDQMIPGFPTKVVVSKDYTLERVTMTVVPDNNTFNEPYMAFPLRTTLLVSDMMSSRVVEIDKSTFEVVRILGSETGVNLLYPRAIGKMPGAGGELLIVDSGNNRVVMLSGDGKNVLRYLGGSGPGENGSGSKNGELNKPRGVLALPDERILVCDTENCRLQTFDKTGRHLQSVGSRGEEPRQFKFPLNAALSPVGDEIAVTDSDNFRVQFFDLNLKYLGEIGRVGDDESVGAGGRRKCQLLKPIGVAYDLAGNLIVSELDGHRLRVFSREKQLISTIGSAGQSENYSFMQPRGVTVDEDGTIFVADTANKAIKMIY